MSTPDETTFDIPFHSDAENQQFWEDFAKAPELVAALEAFADQDKTSLRKATRQTEDAIAGSAAFAAARAMLARHEMEAADADADA